MKNLVLNTFLIRGFDKNITEHIICFKHENSRVNENRIKEINKKLQEEREKLKKALEKDYKGPRTAIKQPDNTDQLKETQDLVSEKKELEPKYIVVAGIGGSNLGAKAVQEAVLGKLHNQKTSDTKILFAETTDSDHINDIINIIEPALQKGENIILNGVSKSGTTTETIANFETIAEKIEEYKDQPEKYITATTVKNSKLHRLAETKGYDTLEIPEDVPGRYSVFTPVALFPLGMLGLEIEKLLEGAKQARKNCLKDKISENPATKSAATIYENNEQGKAIHDLFLYGKDFETIGDWYRQLTAESLGKETKRDGEKTYNGITPITSIGSTDLHSMLQLYLGGPDDKLHSFVWTEKNKQKLSIPEKPEYENLVNDIQNLEMKEIMEAIYKGVNKTFESQERPFNLIELPDKTEKSIGAFMQFKMIEIMYLGTLMEVNPFNQPNVEQYKKETHKILKNKEK